MSLRFVVSSWNVHGLPPKNDNLDEWLHLLEDHHDKLADVYVIGIQEIPSSPPSLLLDYYIRNDPWTKRLLLFLSTKGIVMVDSVRMMGLLLLVATKPRHLPHIREIRTTYTRTGFYGLLGTKGAVSIRFDLYNESFCFVNNHFVAGDQYSLQRNDHFQAVISKTLFPNCESALITDNRYVIMLGDFNYRIDDLEISNIKELVNKQDFEALLANDQLCKNKNDEKCFVGYNEYKITFPPTYKYDLNTNDFDTSLKGRLPAYTDRILWQEETKEVLSMEQTTYTSHMSYSSSDHKPISGEMIVQIPAMLSESPVVEFRFDDSYIPWTSEEDGICIFYVKGYETSSWDWIGLYALDFKSPKDYYTYEWSVSGADATGTDGCMVLFDDVPEEHGYYMFGYWSRKMECVLGFSEPFHVAPVPEPDEPQQITVENPPEADSVPQVEINQELTSEQA
ncbi:inositol polyphosphate 5-phosphatase K-like [Hydractinia symbiolongicarpus]|uniref:inositol polyphosphate 5-phosphatase K-like n=1 Tax=Hydractinia symbiolongicarpus TaxID=13093 RepID=UPI002550A10B|nr:inositol polyphosphate 5-phosphatase K-like [Hydractinia symbiolongicarpus]